MSLSSSRAQETGSILTGEVHVCVNQVLSRFAAPNIIRVPHWLEDSRLVKVRHAPFMALLPDAASGFANAISTISYVG